MGYNDYFWCNEMKSGGITLMQKGAFDFDKSAMKNLTDNIRSSLTSSTAMEIIISIMKQKLGSAGYNNKLYYLQGRTGSGKSTYMISTLFRSFISTGAESGTLYVVEPRIVLARSNAINVSRFNDDINIGDNIGYKTGLSSEVPTNPKSIMYVTAEIFKQKLYSLKEGLFSGIKLVVVDEVHLLDLPGITLLKAIYDFLQVNCDHADCPLFLFTSATIDIPALVTYYHGKKISRDGSIELTPDEIEKVYSDPLMCGYVKGTQNHPVKSLFLTDADEAANNRYVSERQKRASAVVIGRYTARKLIPMAWESNSIITSGDEEINCRDILIFIPVLSVMDSINNILKSSVSSPYLAITPRLEQHELDSWREANRGVKRILFVGYSSGYSKVSENILKYAVDPDKECRKNEMKIFVSTPAIETGKTIATLFIVVDTGLHFTQVYTPLTYDARVFYGKLLPVNKNMVTQRLGRVGREAPGIAVHFYSEKCYNKLPDGDFPSTVNAGALSTIIVDQFRFIKSDKQISYDLVRTNNYLIPISIDILISTGQDIINSFYLTPTGYITNEVNAREGITSWVIYAKYLYYELGHTLFDACFLARANRKYLPMFIMPQKVKFMITLDDIYNSSNYQRQTNQNKNEIIAAIREARMFVNQCMHSSQNSPFVHVKGKMFS